MALSFPVSPSIGDRYPDNPGTSGVTQYYWTGTKWNTVLNTVSLGVSNQGPAIGTNTYNAYNWPLADGADGYQLTTDGTGNLTWEVAAAPSIQVLSILPAELPFDGVRQSFTLVDSTSTPYAPTPSTNLVVFLGGVPQSPGAAYSMTLGTSTINFTEAPLAGSLFYAITNVVV
jgi:hypothetical protein